MEAVIFDFDGTLLDSEREWDNYLWPLVQRTFPKVTWEDFSFFTGTTTRQGYAHFAALHEPTMDLRTYSQEIRSFIPELYQTARLNEGVRELLEALRREGTPMAIATSSERDWIMPSVRSHNIEEFFPAIVTLDDVERAKPHPEPYRLAASKLGVDPQQCAAVEDSVHGIQSAKAAGMTCVGFAYRDNAAQLHEADVCVRHFSDITPDTLRALVRS